MIARCLITLSEGFWWRIADPSPDAIAAAERLDGIAFIADVDETNRTARLVRAIRCDGPARLAQWCRLHRFRSLTPVPDAAPPPAAVAARPSILA
jgi:hypothetical protein